MNKKTVYSVTIIVKHKVQIQYGSVSIYIN